MLVFFYFTLGEFILLRLLSIIWIFILSRSDSILKYLHPHPLRPARSKDDYGLRLSEGSRAEEVPTPGAGRSADRGMCQAEGSRWVQRAKWQ